MKLNLAQRPFVDPRPVVRLAILLWIVGAVVAAVNVSLYLRHYAGSGEQRQQLAALLAEIEQEEALLRRVEEEIGDFDVAWQNAQSAFLNAKIAERTFSWSTLFDRLSEVLPADVRLVTLSPVFGSGRGGGRGGVFEPREDEVLLGIRGAARTSEVLLGFLDALFEHPSFRAADLASESLQDGGHLSFDLDVIYRVALASANEEAVLEGEETDGAAPEALEG